MPLSKNCQLTCCQINCANQILRFPGDVVVFNHIDHTVPLGINTAIRKTKALRMCELGWSRIFPSLAIQLLICKIGEIDAVSMNQRGSSSILMNSGPDVERSWCDVTNLAV